jgi:hypothetical protein
MTKILDDELLHQLRRLDACTLEKLRAYLARDRNQPV